MVSLFSNKVLEQFRWSAIKYAAWGQVNEVDFHMRKALTAFVVASGLLAMPVQADALTIDIGEAILANGASFIGGDSKIQFDSQVSGQSATFSLPSIPGQEYSIQVTGHNNSSTSFFQFLLDADGPGPGGFVQLGDTLNFGGGFPTLTLPTFTNLGNSDLFRIVNGGLGNTAGQITGISLFAVPGSIVGAGLPGLLAACGALLLFARRRQRRA
jgi:hypothetical protein